MEDIQVNDIEEIFSVAEVNETEITLIYEPDYTELAELLEEMNQANDERDEESFNTYSELLFSIDEKLGLLLEQSEMDEEESILFEEVEPKELEEINYTDFLTSLDTTLAHFSLLYETELLRQAEEPVLEEIHSIDYTEMIVSMDTKLEEMLTMKDTVESSSSAIVTYSVFYIPLAVIILSLYWFFSQFMNRHY